MSETVKPTLGKEEFPKLDRSAEGVHRAVGRIAEKLLERARREGLVDGGANVWRDENVGDDGVRRNSYLMVNNNDMSNLMGVTKTTPDGEIKQVEIDTYPDKVGAGLVKGTERTGVQGVPGSYLKNPRDVADVAANTLNQMRGRIAQKEMDRLADAKQQMVDLVNGKEDNK